MTPTAPSPRNTEGIYKAEIIHSQRCGESTEAVELATMVWVFWWDRSVHVRQ